jgi:hypothetical protein
MSSSGIVQWGGLAAITGGVLWVVKGVGILLTGEQLPLVFEAAMLLFALGLLGLHARLGGRASSLEKVGALVAYVSVVSAVVAIVAPLTPFIAVAGFGPLLGLVLLGIATLQTRIFPPPWSILPLVMGLGTPILILAGGGLLATINERLLEIPIVLVGLAWMLLGYSVLVVKSATVERPASVR